MAVTHSRRSSAVSVGSRHKAKSDVLMLATAATKAHQLADISHTHFPRIDYLQLQRQFDAQLINYNTYGHNRLGLALRHLETRIHSDVYLAMLGIATQHRAKVVFAWSERVGIPFAQMRRFLPNPTPFISMFCCWSRWQEKAMTTLKLYESMDKIVFHCNSMRDHFIKMGVSAEKLHVVHYGRDEHFFQPPPQTKQRAQFAVSVGEHRSRDYAALFKAVDGLPVDVTVAASGRWYAAKERQPHALIAPKNVTLTGGLSQIELRQLYAQAQFVILPLQETIYSAGSTVVLEAMAMGRPVIATRRPGITDYIEDGVTGVLVDENDIGALRHAICDLLNHPQKARHMGQNARARSEQHLSLNHYVGQLGDLIQQFL